MAPELCQRLELAAALAALEDGPLARVTLQVAVERVRPVIVVILLQFFIIKSYVLWLIYCLLFKVMFCCYFTYFTIK